MRKRLTIVTGLTVSIILVVVMITAINRKNYLFNNGDVTVKYNNGDRISVSNRYSNGECVIINLIYEGEQTRYNSYIYNDGYSHDILLFNGAGMYTISIWEEKLDGTVENIKNICIESNVETEFTGATYNVEYKKYNESIENLISEQGWTYDTPQEQIFDYFSKYQYNEEVASKVNTGEIRRFIPNIDNVIKNESGICYDIASTITAVERKLGHQSRMVIGTVGESGAHSWSEVRIDGEWINLDTLLRDNYNESIEASIDIIHYY